MNPTEPGDTPGGPWHADPGRDDTGSVDSGAADSGAADSGRGQDASTLAGYRVVRRLGSGRRAVIYLGHAGPRVGPGIESVRRPVTVALKVFDPATDPVSIEREVRALSQSPAGLLPGLLDVATLPDGCVCLVLERLVGGSLNRHLAAIDRLRPGEAVTILAPIVTALSALHEAGFAHESLSLASVLFDEAGRPVLAGLGGLRGLPSAGVDRIPSLRGNYLRLGVLLRAVLESLDPDDPAAPAAGRLIAWFDEAVGAVPFRPCLDQLERRLFGWADATPVRAPGVSEAVRSRAGRAALRIESGGGRAAGTPVRAAEPTAMPSTVRPLAARLLALHLPPEVRTALMSAVDGHPVGRAVARLRDRARLHRRSLWLGGLVAAGLVILAISLLPVGTGTDASGADAPDARVADGARDTAAAEGGRGSDGRDILAAPDLAALSGDEPALAVPVLLRLRAGCLAAASVVCLDGVDQPGSAVMAADTYAARSAQQGGGAADARTFERHAASLVERTGNSALVALAPPADQTRPADQAGPPGLPVSVLLVRGESGWRLREIFDY